MKNKLIVLIGPQHTGKTEWAKKFIIDNGPYIVRVSPEELLYMFRKANAGPPEITKPITAIVESIIFSYLTAGCSVVLDTSLTTGEEYLRYVTETFWEHAEILYKHFDGTLPEIKERETKLLNQGKKDYGRTDLAITAEIGRYRSLLPLLRGMEEAGTLRHILDIDEVDLQRDAYVHD